MTTETRESGGEASAKPDEARRVIKRYSNRKLYDTRDSRYITLQQIGEMVRRGEHVQVLDNRTKEDKTEATLALILSEDLKSEPGREQLGTLRILLQDRGEKLLSSLRVGPIGRLIPGTDRASAASEKPSEAPVVEAPPPVEAVERPGSKSRLDGIVASSRQTLEELQATLDERIQAAVPGLSLVRSLRADLAALEKRLDTIERHLGLPSPDPGDKPEGS
jgi:polyhydroxyalkanoate synthesis repressor PhaR